MNNDFNKAFIVPKLQDMEDLFVEAKLRGLSDQVLDAIRKENDSWLDVSYDDYKERVQKSLKEALNACESEID